MQTNHISRLLAAGIVPFLLLLAACTPAATQEPTATPAPTEPPVPTATPDPQLPLIGSWTSTVTKEDLLRVMPDFHQEALCDNSGTFIWQFNADGTFTIDQTGLPDCPVPANTHFEDTWVLDGNQITFAKGTPEEETYEIAVNSNQLTFKVVSSECPPCIAVNTANLWTRVE